MRRALWEQLGEAPLPLLQRLLAGEANMRAQGAQLDTSEPQHCSRCLAQLGVAAVLAQVVIQCPGFMLVSRLVRLELTLSCLSQDPKGGPATLTCLRCPRPAGAVLREVLTCTSEELAALERFERASSGRVQPCPAPELCRVRTTCPLRAV